MFDEPTSFLDIKQRIIAAKVIRQILDGNLENYVICVEHDLTILDYVSDYVCCFYGEAAAYGVVTTPYAVKTGINIFLDGFIPTENMRFREIPFTFKIQQDLGLKVVPQDMTYKYPDMVKKLEDFTLTAKQGSFSNSQIIVLLGENGTGKTTLIRMLAGLDPDITDMPKLNVSYKPQHLKFEEQYHSMSVRDFLQVRLGTSFLDQKFISEVTKPMQLEDIIDNEIGNLSGGEQQKLAIIISLGRLADIYLLDEPSAYLDSEQRIITSKVIKRFIYNSKRSAFIVEHDFIMATYLADLVIVFEGTPGK